MRLAAAALLALARAASSQTTTTQPEGVLFPTQNSGRINGVRLQVQPDGSVWFLEATSDSIAYLKDGVIKRWQIRTDAQIGANPVDFQIDGNLVWFIESGQSQIDGGTCAYARLDTTTGQLTEWVIPGTIPAAFYRGPDGLVWFPQSGAVMQSFNPDTLEVVNWRSPATYAYADMTVAPDGSFWLADFGNNRIVHWAPGAPTETSWTFFPLTGGRLNPAQVELDENGWLWIVQRSANRVDHFDPFDQHPLLLHGDHQPDPHGPVPEPGLRHVGPDDVLHLGDRPGRRAAVRSPRADPRDVRRRELAGSCGPSPSATPSSCRPSSRPRP